MGKGGPATRTEAWRNSRSGSPRPDREVELPSQQIWEILGERWERSDLRFNGVQQRKEEWEGELEDEAEMEREKVVGSDKNIPRSEAGTEEKATPGMVVVWGREKKERRKSEAEHKSRRMRRRQWLFRSFFTGLYLTDSILVIVVTMWWCERIRLYMLL